MNRQGKVWVQIQIPLLAAALAWPVIQHLVGAGGDWPPVILWPSRLIGTAAVVGAVLLFRSAREVLGEDLVAVPVPREGGQLHRRGVYGVVRHPIYVAIVIGVLGWALAWTSIGGLALAAVITVFFTLKTRAEERYLRRRYPDYESYAETVPRFVPHFGRRTGRVG